MKGYSRSFGRRTQNSRRMLRALRCFLFVLSCFGCLTGQDVEQAATTFRERLKDKPLRINGGISASYQYADISGAAQRFDGSDWNVSAQLTLDVLGIIAPFSAFVSDGSRLYSLPSYQFVGLSPRYKWATAHLGDRSMNFNEFTFSNQNFRGMGLELTPGRWRFAGMYGRLNRLQLGDFNARQELDISYRRMGYAAEAGYQGERYQIKGTVFSAADELPDEVDMNAITGLAPARNIVGSLEGQAQLGKRLTVRGLFAHSWITDNTRAAGVPDSLVSNFLNPNASTSRETALRSSLNYAAEKANYTLGYERISPNYRSLGTLYITPDRENVTLGSAFQLFKNKVTVALNGGIQRNNLAGNRANEQRRWIGQVAATARPGERFSANLNLSNFQNTSRLRTFFDAQTLTDSLFIAQVNRSARLGLRLARPKEEAPGTWSLNFSVQEAQAIQDEVITTFVSTNYNTYLGYAGSTRSGFTYQVQTLFGIAEAANLGNRIVSPSLGLAKSFNEDELQIGLTSSYSFVDYDSQPPGRVLLGRLTLGLKALENGLLTLRTQYTHRAVGERDPLSEIIAAANYTWNF